MDSDYYLDKREKMRYNKPFCGDNSGKNCSNCGMESNGDSAKCPHCGAHVKKDRVNNGNMKRVNWQLPHNQSSEIPRNTWKNQLSPANNQMTMQARGWTLNTMAGENSQFPNDSSQTNFQRTDPNANSMDVSVCDNCGNDVSSERCLRCSAFMKNLSSRREKRIKTNTNNVYYDDGCPALMEDGRFITNWRPSNEITEEIGTWNNIGNSNQLRLFLQTNGTNLLKKQNSYLTQNNSCQSKTACSEGYYDLWMKGQGNWDTFFDHER